MLNIVKSNNPMALRFVASIKWKGQTGASRGFAVFENPIQGIRAGMVNLKNGYFGRGINTLRAIFQRYAPAGDGNNNPERYAIRAMQIINSIDYFATKTTIASIDTPLTLNNQLMWDLSYAIIEVETGGQFGRYFNQVEVLNYALEFYQYGQERKVEQTPEYLYVLNSQGQRLSNNLRKKNFDTKEPVKKKVITVSFIVLAILIFLVLRKTLKK